MNKIKQEINANKFLQHSILIGLGMAIGGLAGSTLSDAVNQNPPLPPSESIVATIGKQAIYLRDIENNTTVLQARFDADTRYHEAQQTEILAKLDAWRLQQEAQHQKMSVGDLLEAYALPPRTIQTSGQLLEFIKIVGNDDVEQSDPEFKEFWDEFSSKSNVEDRQAVDKLLYSDQVKALYRKKYLEELAEHYPSKILLPIPQMPDGLRVARSTTSNLVKGDPQAPITIEEFSDPNCFYCRKEQSTLKELDRQYPGQIRWVYHHQLLDDAEDSVSFQLAEASFCAADQQKFWEFNDVIYQQSNLQEPDWGQIAQKANIDSVPLMACLNAHVYRDRVNADLAEAQRLELAGTPVYIINGIKKEGAIGLDEFKTLIDVELKQATGGGQSSISASNRAIKNPWYALITTFWHRIVG
ncbi:MAG: hypothetical protein D4R98_06520 [Comamonadaceae bacterium]|nr:MAG: hypothetical protein D4R98_06520 [Comamonadaceae bacterium]